MDLNEARKRLPELAGLSDESALNVIHQVYYPSMDRMALADRLGFKAPPPPTPERSMARAAGDLGLQFAGGAVSGVRMMSDLFGANNAVSGGLRSAEDALRELQSATAKADQQRIAEIMKESESKGFADQVVAGVKAFGQAPAAMIAQALGTSVPTLATALIPGAVPARLGMAAKAGITAGQRTALGAGIGAAQGAGNIKSVVYDEVMQKPLAGETPEQTQARAEAAQAYGSENTGQIVLGGVLGAAAGSTGMERALSGLRNGVTQAAPGMAARVGMGAMTEAVPEIAQGGQEKLAGNLALRNEGFDVDPMAGVYAGATMEGLAGGLVGGATSIPRPSVIGEREPVPQPTPIPPVEPTGPMTKALGALGPRLTSTPTIDLLGRNTDPLAAQITADRQQADDATMARDQFADRNAASLMGGGLDGSRADPLANMLADSRTSDANSFTNIQQAGNRRPPMPASDAARILDEAKNRGMDLTAAPHPDGGYVVVPRPWVMPDVAAQAETEIADTLVRMQQAESAPVDRAPRTGSTQAVDLNLNPDPVAGYIEDLRKTNTPASRAYVGEFDAGRVTRADVEQRMQIERGKTPDERLAEAAAQAPKDGDILTPSGNPFKTLMAAKLASKKTPGSVIEVAGGYAIRTQESTLANTSAQEVATADAEPVQATQPAAKIPADAGQAGEAVDAAAAPGIADGAAAVPGSDEPGAMEALSNVQDQTQGTAGAQATEAAPVEAPAPAGGDVAAATGIPAAPGAGGVQADGLDDLGPDTFAGSIKREIESRAEEARRRVKAKKPAPLNAAEPEAPDTEVYRATPDGNGMFTLKSDEYTIAGNGDGSPRKFTSELDAVKWAAQNGFNTDPSTNPPKTNTSAEPVQETAKTAQVELLGRNSQPISEGGKPFTTQAEAKKEKKLHPTMRVVKSDDGKGYVLKPMSEKQIRAQEIAARNIKGAATGEEGPQSLHGFILSRGGLAKSSMADAGFDKNERIGNRWLFTNDGKTLAQMSELLHEAGYISEETENAVSEGLRRSLVNPVYTPDGYEIMAQAQAEARFEDHLAAQQEAPQAVDESAEDFDPFPETESYTEADAEAAGFDDASKEDQAAFAALLHAAEAEGIDTELITEQAAQATQNGTDDDYRNETRALIEAARSERAQAAERASAEQGRKDAEREGGDDGRQGDGEQGAPGEQPGLTLEDRPDGTLAVTGDTKALRERLTAAGIPSRSIMPSATGVLVGKTQVQRARNVLEGRDADKKAARTLNEEGRATDGKPINAGDVFTTLSGRETTPYPKQQGQKYASQWLIDNAIAEAKQRGDDFNATGFGAEKPMKDGTLPTASRESMLMYLFGEQPAVVPRILKPLAGEKPAASVPPAVRDSVKWALGRLRDVESALSGVERARGRGHMLALEWQDQQEKIQPARAKLDEFRRLAPGNGIDADAFIKEMGGEPNLERFNVTPVKAEPKPPAVKAPAKVTPQIPSSRQLADMIQIAADSIDKLRKPDVDRVLNEAPAHFRAAMAMHIREKRPDLADEVRDVMDEISNAPALTAPTRADIEAQQARTEQAARDKAAADRAADRTAAQDEERKRIAKASEQAADTFELGGDAMANLTGQKDIFGAAGQATPQAEEQAPEFNAQAAWDGMTPAARGAMLDKWAGAGQTDMGERYKARAWGSFNAGEKGTLTTVLKAAQDQADDRAETVKSSLTVGKTVADMTRDEMAQKGSEDFAAGVERQAGVKAAGYKFEAWLIGWNEAKADAEAKQSGKVAVPSDFPLQEVSGSYSGISHSGSSRALSDRSAFVERVQSLYDEGKELAKTEAQQEALDKAIQTYKDEYIAQTLSLARVRSGTYSAFVAGRAKINTRQADSRNSALDKAIDRFTAWDKEAAPKVKAAVLEARTTEEVAAEQSEKDAAQAAKQEKRQRSEVDLMRKILAAKSSGEQIEMVGVIVTKVNNDKDGYPLTLTIKAKDGSALTNDKLNLATEIFGKRGIEGIRQGKEKIRALVDAIKAESAQDSAPEPAKPASKTPTVDRHEAVMQAVREGKATAEQFKASFEEVVSGRAAIVVELNTKTKAQLLAELNGWHQQRYANENKPEIVDALYRDMVSSYVLGESLSYGMGKGAHEAAVRARVEATDDAKLAKYAEERKAAIAEAMEARKARADGLADPKTLNDFRSVLTERLRAGQTRQEAFLSLTPEQRVRYDELEAENSRETREARKRERKTEVRAAGQTTGGEIIATKHTRDGYDLFVVKLADRLSKEDYSTVLTSAKRLGGWYSAFRGNGAIPGFQFKDKANAEAFLKLAGGDTTDAQAQAEQRRDAFEDDRSQTAVERLRAMADKLTEQAADIEGADRKTNTARRARFAASALNNASEMKAKASTMRNIAQAIEADGAKFLDAVRTKSQVDMLTSYVRTAKDNELRAKYPTYADQEKRKGEPPTAETADFAEFPMFTAYRSDLASLARQMLEVEGTKKLGTQLMSVADDVTDAYIEFAKQPANLLRLSTFSYKRGDEVKTAIFASRDIAEKAIKRSGLTGKAMVLAEKRGVNRIIMSPSEAMNQKIWEGDGDKRITLTTDAGNTLVEAIGRRGTKQNNLTVPWQFQTAYDRRKALSRMGIETASEFRSALREFIGLQERATANKVREMELAMVGKKNDGLDFFPTPQDVADQMVEAADIESGMLVLEPSAGMAHIADRIRAAGAEPDVGELSGDRRELLEEKGYNVVAGDFMEFTAPAERGFTFGDLMRAPDGTMGILRGQGGMGSDRVRLVSDEAEPRELGKFDFSELEGVERRGAMSGYDRIIMNPPFSNRRDAEHVQHAYKLLKPGGRLVSIMGEGVFFGQDKKAQEFREWLESVNGTDEKLPPGSFMDPSLPVNTGVNARMVVIDKPSGSTKQADAGGDTPVFSRASSKPAGITKKTAADVVAAIRARWDNAPEVEVAQDMADPVIPQDVRDYAEKQNSLGAKGEPEGFYYKGKAYIVAGALNSPSDVIRVLFHEVLGHHGLRGVFGDDLKPILQQLAALRRADVAAKAKEYGLDMGKEADRLHAAEEVLAVMAQTSPELGYVKRAIAAIRAWMRKHVPGFQDMKLTDADIIAGYILPARRWVYGDDVGNIERMIDASLQSIENSFPNSKLIGYDSATNQFYRTDTGQRFANRGQLAGVVGRSIRSRSQNAGGLGSTGQAGWRTVARAALFRDLKAAARLVAQPQDGRTVLDRLREVGAGLERGETEGGRQPTENRIFYSRSGVEQDEAAGSDVQTSGAGKTEQTETAAFKRWFAGSKVVDANGKPLVVYHGTRREFNVFAKSKPRGAFGNPEGIYFTSDKREAEQFAEDVDGAMDEKSRIVPVYLSIRNEQDGLIRKREDGTTEYIVFRPEQIKSATGNRGTFDPADPDIRFSIAGDIKKAIPAFDVKTAPKNNWAHYRGMAMQALGRRQIVDLYAEELPQLAQYDYLVQQMDAEKNDSGAEADKLAQAWGKLRDEKQLAELMHDATLAQIDPDKPKMPGILDSQYKELKARFDALTPEAQALYRQARDMYDGHYRKVQKAIKERIERSEMSAGQKRQIMAKMDEELFKKLKGVYFPLARFGQYVIVVKDANGEVKNVTRAETVGEAEEARKELHKAFPKHMGYTVGKVLKQAEFNAGRDAVGKGFMADLMDALDSKGIDDELRDTVAQLYLSSLPDLSWAKHGIHRKGTPGFSQDARRAFAQNMFHGARYLAKLRYADQLQDELIAMQDHVKAYEGVEEYDSIQAQQVVDEMVKRHEIMMNPKTSGVSTWMTSVGFVFHLGLSPASAMVNLSQTALVAYPMMGAKWGWGKASSALLAASQDVVKAKNDLGAILKGDELDAYERAVKDGTIDVTMAHDLAGISQGEDQKVFWKIRPVMRAASFMFHHAERFNRQATFIAAWRMAKEAGPDKTADQLYEEAKKLTYDSHFDYSASNRPRVMQGNWQRVIFLFKQYSQAMVYTLSRNAYLSMKGLTPADRALARKNLGGILATHAAAAGVLGLPLVGPLLTAASFIGSDDDEPWDAEVAMQNVMADMVGPKAAEVMARGFSRLTPFDLSGRVALNKLILPDVQEGLEGKQWAESAMSAALGPVAGIGVNMARGFQKITDGQYMTGLEDMMPTALRGPLRAMRYASEGAVDKTGVVIADDVGAGSIAGQALGFSPSEVRRATERKAAIMDYDRSLADRRSSLVRQWAEAQMAGDTDGVQDVMEEVKSFNQKNPSRKITMPHLIQSVRARRRRIEQAEDGVYLPKNREGAREAVRF